MSVSDKFAGFVVMWKDQYDRGIIGKELTAVCANVQFFITDGVLNYQYGNGGFKAPYTFAPKWFRPSLTQNPENFQLISFLPKEDAAKPRESSVSKFLSFSQKKMGLEITDKQIELYATWCGRCWVKSNLSHTIISGPDILEEYYTHYHGSCMYRKPEVKMYAYSPPDAVPGFGIEQIICINEQGEHIGRALLWHTDKGLFMDRIYPSNTGVHVDYLKGVAESEGWDYKAKQTYGDDTGRNLRHLVKIRDIGAYTYFDTMRAQKLVEEDGKRFLYASNSSDHLEKNVKAKAIAKRDGEMMDTYLNKKFQMGEFRYYPELKDVVAAEAVRQLFREEGDKLVLRTNIAKSEFLGRYFDLDKVVALTHGRAAGDFAPTDYPYLVYNDGDFAALRKDLDWTDDQGWLPGSGKNHDSGPLVEYNGFVESEVYFTDINSRQVIVRLDGFWVNGDKAKVLVTNIRTSTQITIDLSSVSPLIRPTDEDIELFSNISIRGDIVQLRNDLDGTLMCGQIFPAGTIGVVEVFHEESETVFARFPSVDGRNAAYWHSLSSTALRRVARPGDTIVVPTNSDLQGKQVRYAGLSRELVVLSVDRAELSYTLPELVRTNLFGTEAEHGAPEAIQEAVV